MLGRVAIDPSHAPTKQMARKSASATTWRRGLARLPSGRSFRLLVGDAMAAPEIDLSPV
jgi:hypothetical protein